MSRAIMAVMQWLFLPHQVRRTTLICCLAAGVLAGIALAQLGGRLEGLWLWAVVVALIVPILRRPRIAIGFVAIAGMMIGLVRGGDKWQELGTLQTYVGQRVVVQGTVVDDPMYGKRGERQFYLENITIDQQKLSGTVRVSTYAYTTFGRSDKVTLAGILRDGFGNYQASLYFATVTGVEEQRNALGILRDQFAAGVRNAISEPAASLGLGFVIGERNELPEHLDDAMRYVGLTHIVVASGYNLTVLVRAARRLLAKRSKYQALVAALGLMSGFVVITGLSPSMSRAALVTGLSVWAWYYGRHIHPVVLLLFVAALTAYINPLYLWSDVGWYLSFLAFAGVLIVAPLVAAWIYQKKKPSLLAQVVIETLAAQALTLPISLAIFGYISYVALPANILLVPLVPLAMILTLVAGLMGMAIPALAGWVGTLADGLLGTMVRVIDAMAAPDWIYQEFRISIVVMVALYVAIGVGTWLAARKSGFNFRKSNIVE